MTITDYVRYGLAVALAHKYAFIAAIVLYECVLSFMIANRVILEISGPESANQKNIDLVSNSVRNVLIMGVAVITLSGFEVLWLTLPSKGDFVTPLQFSVTIASLVSCLVVNTGVWVTLYRVKRALKGR